MILSKSLVAAARPKPPASGILLVFLLLSAPSENLIFSRTQLVSADRKNRQTREAVGRWRLAALAAAQRLPAMAICLWSGRNHGTWINSNTWMVSCARFAHGIVLVLFRIRSFSLLRERATQPTADAGCAFPRDHASHYRRLRSSGRLGMVLCSRRRDRPVRSDTAVGPIPCYV